MSIQKFFKEALQWKLAGGAQSAGVATFATDPLTGKATALVGSDGGTVAIPISVTKNSASAAAANLAAIQSVIDTYASAQISADGNDVVYVSGPIVLHTNTTLSLNGCTIKLASGVGDNIFKNDAYSRAKVTLTGAFTSSGIVGTVNHTAHGYVAGDVVEIGGSTSAAYNGVYKVQSASANSFTVNCPYIPLVATALGTVWIRKADSNITVMNGWMDYDSTNQPGRTDPRAMCSIFAGIYGLTLKDIGGKNCAKYAFLIGGVADFDFRNLSFYNTAGGSDGLHLQGPAHRGSSTGHFGMTGDDFVSLTCGDYTTWEISRGDFVDLAFRDLNADYCAKNVFKYAGNTPYRAENLIVEKLRGYCVLNAVTLFDDTVGSSLIGTAGGAIKIRDISVNTGAGMPGVNVSIGGKIDLLEIDGIDYNKCSTAAVNLVSGSALGVVHIRNIYALSTPLVGGRSCVGIHNITADMIDVELNAITDTSGHGVVFNTDAGSAVIGTLIVRGRFKNVSGTANAVVWHEYGTVGTVIFPDLEVVSNGQTQVYRQLSTTSGAPSVIFGNVHTDTVARLAEFQVASKCQLNGVLMTNQANQPIRGYGTSTAIRIEGNIQVSGAAAVDVTLATGTPVFSLRGNIRANGTEITGATIGDEFFNTNAAWASGTGTDKRGKYGYTGAAWAKIYGPA